MFGHLKAIKQAAKEVQVLGIEPHRSTYVIGQESLRSLYNVIFAYDPFYALRWKITVVVYRFKNCLEDKWKKLIN